MVKSSPFKTYYLIGIPIREFFWGSLKTQSLTHSQVDLTPLFNKIIIVEFYWWDTFRHFVRASIIGVVEYLLSTII